MIEPNDDERIGFNVASDKKRPTFEITMKDYEWTISLSTKDFMIWKYH